MSNRLFAALLLGSVAVATLAIGGQTPSASAPAATQPPQNADRQAILKSAQDFAAAFNRGDAKALAAMWTMNGEAREADGETLVGRDAIERTYAAVFAANPGAKIEVIVKSLRFPSADLAVEEGLVRRAAGKTLPASVAYVAIHVREQGQWKIALSSSAGDSRDHLEDLDWLLGDWAFAGKDSAVKFSFVKDAKKPLITGAFTRTSEGKEPVSSSIRIAFDPETGRLRSWGFEDDGAHSQGLWSNDGKSWLIEVRGVTAGGTPFAETIVLQRVGEAITWRSIDRTLGDAELPDTPPLRLTRANSGR